MDVLPATPSVSEIIKSAGGAVKIAAESEGEITADAVYKWPKIGIPDRHWPLIIRLSNATPAELMAANVVARSAEQVA